MDKLISMQVFEKVAKHNSFTAAANDMGLSKAMVSKHIASLENSIEVLLLNRTTRRLSLTESGTAYLEHLQSTVSFQTGSPAEVRFDSMGRPAAPRTIVIETTDMSKTITISATGRVTVTG